MALRDSIVGDYASFDATETVTLRHRTIPAGTLTNTTGVTALQESSDRERDMGISTAEDTTVWHLWTNTMSNAVPMQGDLIIEADATTWMVQSASLETLQTRYRCAAQKITS